MREDILAPVTVTDISRGQLPPFRHTQIEKEIRSWLEDVDTSLVDDPYAFLLSCDLPVHDDVLGIVYQSLLPEGKKARKGSYYTPAPIVRDIAAAYVRPASRVLDPACGTGQFLLIFSETVDNPEYLYGFDTDPVAVRIARLNLLLKQKEKVFVPNIYRYNTLFDAGNTLFHSFPGGNRGFDLIATNPPWGVHFSGREKKMLAGRFPGITSGESFSCFLKAGLDLLREGGVLSYVLPEAILNVKTHRDIRKILLETTQILKIVWLGRVFRNVFTPVIRLDLVRQPVRKNPVIIVNGEKQYSIPQERWLHNPDHVFDIHTDDTDNRILERVWATEHTTLRGQAEWALGIVTGNNRAFVRATPQEGYEPVYRGKDVGQFVLKEPSGYIRFTPGRFQQVAPEEKYRAPEKLIYRFITKHPVFAWDDRQRLTLNSANVVIPRVPGYPVKTIAALFNSSLYRFIFRKKFSSIKILRSHLEQLPLPLWDRKTLEHISKMVDDLMDDKISFETLDRYIMEKFGLSKEDKTYILNTIRDPIKLPRYGKQNPKPHRFIHKKVFYG